MLILHYGKGTHILGTIGALEDNHGIVGMIRDRNVCYLIARVFDDNRISAYTSDIMDAIRWSVEQKASVINLSLGGTLYYPWIDQYFRKLHKKHNVIVVAAAGNHGDTRQSFPASYNGVLSIAAFDKHFERAPFSQYNNRVDFAAPGVSVLSTTPLTNVGRFWLDIPASPKAHILGSVAYSPNAYEGSYGPTLFCPFSENETCPTGDGGHICVFER